MRLPLLLTTILSSWASHVSAAEPPATGPGSSASSAPTLAVAPSVPASSAAVADVRAKAGPGQKPLHVAIGADRMLRARACANRACSGRGASDVEVELPEGAGGDLTAVKLQELRLGQKRRAVWVKAPGKGNRSWYAVFGVQPGSPKASLLFQGWDGYISGIEGERRGRHVRTRKVGKTGNVTLLISDFREDLTLCGRPALLGPRALSGHDLKFHGATVSRLSSKDRANAKKIKARPVTAETKAGSPGLLTAVAASSAIGNPSYLTDGDESTTWAEARTGDGRGEFVIMRSSSGVPLTGFEFTVRTDTVKNKNARSPEEIWLVTDDALFDVRFPADAFRQPGTYAIDLPSEVTTECVAIVLGRTRRNKAKSEVSLTEVAAVSSLSKEPVASLIAALDTDAADPAVGMLVHRGEPAYVALAKAYPSLSPKARLRALHVLDHGPCEFSGATYAEALLGPEARARAHAEARVGRCSEQATEVLVVALDAPGIRSQRAAEHLADLDPGRAVEEIVVRMPAMTVDARRLIRPTLARAATTPRAKGAVRKMLGQDLPPESTTEILRLAGPDLSRLQPEAGAAFARLSNKELDFRNRYLLIEPAASLSSSDPAASSFIRVAMQNDSDWRIRAKAAQSVSDPAPFLPQLIVATTDDEVRVREAATRSLGGAKDVEAEEVVRVRLSEDDWPMVRVAAAEALREGLAGGDNDAVLMEALADPSRRVRQAAALSLGARGAKAASARLRQILVNGEEHPDVRGAAAHALASLCDAASIDVLTKLALAAARPGSDKSSQLVSAAALRALGRLHPADLDSRTAPLVTDDTPAFVRGAALRSRAAPPTCGPGVPSGS
jgi:HEAT repeat protein